MLFHVNLLQLRTVKDLSEGLNADSVNRMKITSSGRESTPAPPNAEEPRPHGFTNIADSEVCVPRKTIPVASKTICGSEVAAGALNVDISVIETHHENVAKRKAAKHTDTMLHDLALVSDDFNGSCKKQKRIAALDVETETSEDIHIQDCNTSEKSRLLDVGLHRKVELLMPAKDYGSASYDEAEDKVRDGQEGDMEVLELKHFSDSIGGQIEGVSRSSGWKPMEKELYVKGLEIFGRNRSASTFLRLHITTVTWILCLLCLPLMYTIYCSCLIARNLLSGLKTCIEVFSYMHEGGVSIPHKSVVGPTSIIEDNGKTDTDQTVSIITIIL